jgi:ComF family protein
MPFGTGDVMISAAAVARPPAYDRARAVARFDGVMRDLIHAFKYGDRHDARRLFVRWMLDAGRDLTRDAQIVVPVPLAWSRLVWRRYNQAAILAGEIARASQIAYGPAVLRRTRKTPSQVGLTADQRQRNVAGAFGVPASQARHVHNRSVLLIDDVITTGATVEACARVLRRNGATRVDVLALALAS